MFRQEKHQQWNQRAEKQTQSPVLDQDWKIINEILTNIRMTYEKKKNRRIKSRIEIGGQIFKLIWDQKKIRDKIVFSKGMKIYYHIKFLTN